MFDSAMPKCGIFYVDVHSAFACEHMPSWISSHELMGSFTYYNPILKRGFEKFLSDIKSAGVQG